jgi:RNA polymerase sigma factor (sigma-70 family)
LFTCTLVKRFFMTPETAKTPTTPAEITSGVNRKEWESLQLVWKMNAPLVNKLISQCLGQTPFNQDLAMDVFEVLITTDDHLPSLNDITRFLNNVTKNKCLDHRRKMAIQESHEGRVIYHMRSMENDDIEIAEATAYNQMLIRDKIAQIPGQPGKVCHMHWIQKLSKEEIALQLGIEVKTVENNLSSGITFLKINRQQPHRNFSYPLIIFLIIYLYEKI